MTILSTAADSRQVCSWGSPPSCSSCIQHHAPRSTRRLQRHWRGLHVICRIWLFPINTEHSARSMYKKDDPRGLWRVWLSISLSLASWASMFATVWLWPLWRSGLGYSSDVLICGGGRSQVMYFLPDLFKFEMQGIAVGGAKEEGALYQQKRSGTSSFLPYVTHNI